MGKWILVLKLLGQDHETGEMDWHEAVRVENLSFRVCIAELVEMVHIFQMNGIKHDIYCKEMSTDEEKE